MLMNRPIVLAACLLVLMPATLLSAPAPKTGNTEPALTTSGPLTLTLADAILMALENNRSLQVQRLDPLIQETFEQEARAEFDPSLDTELSHAREKSLRLPSTGTRLNEVDTDTFLGSVSLDTYLPTGTTVSIGVDTRIADDNTADNTLAATRMGITLTQALLRGFGTDANLAVLRQARLNTELSRYELQGFSQTLVSQVETAYWDYALSLRQVDIVAESLRLARQQLDETREMIQVGTQAESELAAVQAEVAIQLQGRIDVTSALEANRLRLLRLINPPDPQLWDRSVTLIHPPQVPDIALGPVSAHVDDGLRLRPEIRQAELEIQHQILEVVRTKNGMLPKLDLFITLGKTGYAESFGDSVNGPDDEGFDSQVGFTLNYPFVNRGAKARRDRAQYSKQRAAEALNNLKQLVALDIHIAFIEVNRTRQQIEASTATRKFQEEKLRTETEKFRVGRSTNLLVAQAQRDLLSSRLDEVRAVVNYLKALTDFYRLEGTLLTHRGIRMSQ